MGKSQELEYHIAHKGIQLYPSFSQSWARQIGEKNIRILLPLHEDIKPNTSFSTKQPASKLSSHEKSNDIADLMNQDQKLADWSFKNQLESANVSTRGVYACTVERMTHSNNIKIQEIEYNK
jgi:hypothetical protein